MITHLPSGSNAVGHTLVLSAQDHLLTRALLPPSPKALRQEGPHPATGVGRWPRSDPSVVPPQPVQG